MASNAEPALPAPYSLVGSALHRAARPGYHQWLEHVRPAAGCTRPIRLHGLIDTVDPSTGQRLARLDTTALPDGVIYKACGNRRHSVCPACARTYQYDAYQLLRAGLAGGKGVPESVTTHPAVFLTLTAPSFGTVHTRPVNRHTCRTRQRCDCRPDPCHPRRPGSATVATCAHGRPLVCWTRHQDGDPTLGQPLCPDCYHHDRHVVWNHHAGELWRRTKIAIERHLAATCRRRGIPPAPTHPGRRPAPPVRVAHGKVAEFQTRGAVHFHAILRLDGRHRSDQLVAPPAGIGLHDLVDAVTHAANTRYTTAGHPDQPAGWNLTWGPQVDIRPITLTTGEITDTLAAAYLAKYATKSTEATGHTCTRLTGETITLYADPAGNHTARLIHAAWHLGRPQPRPVDTDASTPPPNPWIALRRWAHMLGYGGHFLTKARHYSTTLTQLRTARAEHRRTHHHGEPDAPPVITPETAPVLVGALTYTGTGWHTTGDALLANTAAALARERQRTAHQELAHELGTDPPARTALTAA